MQPTDDFKRQVNSISKQLKERDRDKWGILNPLESPFLMRWDVVTAVALLYTATLTPFEVAFIASPESVMNVWFLINRSIDLIFVSDLLLQFFIAFEALDSKNADGHGIFHTHVLIWDRARIAKHYLLGSFVIDVISILPSALDIFPFVLDEENGNVGILSDLRTLRALRALRLIKLVRLLRAQRVINRVSTRISIPFDYLSMIICLMAVLLTAHWYACIFALQATLHESPADTWLGVYGYCEEAFYPPNETRPDAEEVFSIECPGLKTSEWYIAAFAWASMVITGTGGTDAYPNQNSAFETVLVVLLVLFGALMWTQVLATFCDIATNADPAKIEYRQLLDDVNRFCKQEKLPLELRRRLRQYFQQRRHILKARSTASVIFKMSSSLQQEVTMLVHYHWLRHLWFLKGSEPACLVAVALGTEGRVFAPSEVPDIETMYIIHKGCVLFGGRVLTSGKMWGEDIILSNPQNYTPMMALCMGYVETFTISRGKLISIISRFPSAQSCVRRAALKVALRRTMLRIREEAMKLERRLGRGRRAREAMNGDDFLQRVLAAALQPEALAEKGLAKGEVVRPAQLENPDKSLTVSASDSPHPHQREDPPWHKPATPKRVEVAPPSFSSGYRGPAYYEHCDEIKQTKAEVATLCMDMNHTKLVVDSLRADMAMLRKGMSQLLAAQHLPEMTSHSDRLAPILPLSPTERQGRRRDFQQIHDLKEQVATARSALAKMGAHAASAAVLQRVPVLKPMASTKVDEVDNLTSPGPESPPRGHGQEEDEPEPLVPPPPFPPPDP